MNSKTWQIISWSLFVVWVICAILNMTRFDAGLLTSYGADITIPAWLYISARSLDNPEQLTLIHRLFGRSPERAALVFFVASSLTEISQYFYPKGIFQGTFDYFDLLAYAAGIGICYVFDKNHKLSQTQDENI